MQYHLDTIPVWEAMEQNTACPLCALYRRVEASEIERSLGEMCIRDRRKARLSSCTTEITHRSPSAIHCPINSNSCFWYARSR